MSQDYRIYKPNKSNNGCASQWQFRVKEVVKDEKPIKKFMLFLVMAPETGKDDNGNSSFGWKDQALTVSLGDNDVGEMLAVLYGRKKEVGTGKGLFHQNPKGNASINFGYNDKNVLFLKVSVKHGKDQPKQLFHSITDSESMILKTLLEEFVKSKYHWY